MISIPNFYVIIKKIRENKLQCTRNNKETIQIVIILRIMSDVYILPHLLCKWKQNSKVSIKQQNF